MSIPPTFSTKKAAIISALATPDAEYTDLSPKGSVDEAIRPLVALLNGLNGVVTTSSCAGRASVFVEGEKGGGSGGEGSFEGVQVANSKQTSVPGGKGRGGHWLFVSHDLEGLAGLAETLQKEGLNLRQKSSSTSVPSFAVPINGSLSSVSSLRLIKFQFEPMILHLSTASLSHARPILTAALAAGFRESGLQSLGDPGAYDVPDLHSNANTSNDIGPGESGTHRGLRGSETVDVSGGSHNSTATAAHTFAKSERRPFAPQKQTSFPTIGIRSAGLAFSTVIGFVDANGTFQSLVDKSYIVLVAELAKERFGANKARMCRFSEALTVKEARPKDTKPRRTRKSGRTKGSGNEDVADTTLVLVGEHDEGA